MLQATFAWNPEKLQNMLHTPHMNDDYCSQCEEKKQNKNQENMLSFDCRQNKKKKIENETKKTLLQLTTYVMCHKLNSDFSKLCLLS